MRPFILNRQETTQNPEKRTGGREREKDDTREREVTPVRQEGNCTEHRSAE